MKPSEKEEERVKLRVTLREARLTMERESAFAVSYALSLATGNTENLKKAVRIFEKANPGHSVYHWRAGTTETLERILLAFDRAIALADPRTCPTCGKRMFEQQTQSDAHPEIHFRCSNEHHVWLPRTALP